MNSGNVYQAGEAMRTSLKSAVKVQTLVPNADIEGVLSHERRYLHTFFVKLVDADIYTLSDLMRYSKEELFAAAPTSKSNQTRFLSYVKRGVIALRPS